MASRRVWGTAAAEVKGVARRPKAVRALIRILCEFGGLVWSVGMVEGKFWWEAAGRTWSRCVVDRVVRSWLGRKGRES